MKDFYIKMQIVYRKGLLAVHVEYWWNTDLRDESYSDEPPIMQILEWLGK